MYLPSTTNSSPFYRSFAGSYVLLWRRGSNVLTARDLMVTRDERVKLLNGYNLEISELEPQDAGDYVCQISDKVNRDQVHTVEILGNLKKKYIERVYPIYARITFICFHIPNASCCPFLTDQSSCKFRFLDIRMLLYPD